MSLKIPCPHCGERPIEEFMYGEIPNVPETLTDPDERDIDRGFMLSNLEGETVEAWFHTYGCRRWLKLKRNTKTDLILSD
jgi:heterotetrameric sarcosine oxidase delta subunit